MDVTFNNEEKQFVLDFEHISLIITMVWMAGLLLFTSCSKDESATPILPVPSADSLSLNVSDISSDYRAGSHHVNLKSNTHWEITCNQRWVSIYPPVGENNHTIAINWTENTEAKQRVAIITVSAGKLKQEIELRQEARADTAHLVSYRGIIGNLIHNEEDSVELIFDKPVKLKSMASSSGCKPQYYDGGRIVHQAIGSGWAGQSRLTTFLVENVDSVQTKGNVTVNFFDQKFTFEGDGVIRHVLVSDDEESLWVSISRKSLWSGNNGDKVLQVSAADGHILKEIDMPFAPGYLTMNPYNGQLYAMPCNNSTEVGYVNSFCRIDPQQGLITATYTIEPSTKAHPQYPPIYPRELEFTRDGLGVLILAAKLSDGLEWRYVNSREDDKITESGYDFPDYNFEHVYASHDHQRIYASEYPAVYYNLSYITSQHPAPKRYNIKGDFNSDKYYAGGRMMDMVFSPWDERTFICTAPGSQCVVTLEPQVGYSEVTEAEAREAKAAWDRSNPQNDWIYQVCALDNHLLLLDMKRADCLFFCVHPWDWGSTDIIRVRHIQKTDQLLVATQNAIWLLDAAQMKK